MTDETKPPEPGEDAATQVLDPSAEDAVTGPTEAADTQALPGPGSASDAGATAGGALLERLEMPIEVRFGELRWTLGRLLELRVGDAVPVGPDGNDVVRLFVQGRPFATGELVVVNGRFGFRVTELLRGGEA